VFDLSPLKVLVVLVVALVLLGPDKVPQFARQLGAAWATLRRWHQRIEEEVRSSVPDLPSTQEIAKAVRAPAAFLDSLVSSGTDPSAPAPGVTESSNGTGRGPVVDRPTGRMAGRPVPPGRGVTLPDDPGMN